MAMNKLTDADRDRISSAVSAAEMHSAGEIVTIVTDRSDGYSDVALAWAVLAAFAVLLAMDLAPHFFLATFDRLTGSWATEWTPRAVLGLATTLAMLKFVAVWLAQLWPPLKFWLVPRAIRSGRVHTRALTCFKVGAERRTHGRTGILIYLSLAEHRAEIIADEAISAQVAPEVWGDAMQAMLAQLRQGKVADGMIAAIEQVGTILARHCPRADDDINELHDRLIEV